MVVDLRFKKAHRTETSGFHVVEDMKRTAFTLIELLVVIGIVALASAILLPVFSQVREKGRQTVCLSNERQIGLAFVMYTHDNDNYLPPDGNGWAGAIYPGVRRVGVFHCPSDAAASNPPYYPVSYGVNADLWHLITLGGGKRLLVPHTTAEVSSKTVLLFEVVHATAKLTTLSEGWRIGGAAPRATSAAGNGGSLSVVGVTWGGMKFDINEDVRYATGVMSGAPRFNEDTNTYYEGRGRHHEGANFLFSDVHVSWLNPQQVSTGADAAAPNDSPTVPGIGPTVLTAAGSENSHFTATFSTK